MEINEIRPFFAKAMHVMIQLAPDRGSQPAEEAMEEDFNFDLE